MKLTLWILFKIHIFERSCSTLTKNRKKEFLIKTLKNTDIKSSNMFSSIYYDRYVYYSNWLNNDNRPNIMNKKKDSHYIW